MSAVNGQVPITVEGVVEAVNATGVKLHGNWVNISRFGTPPALPAKGAHVRLELDARGFIQSVTELPNQLPDSLPVGRDTVAPMSTDIAQVLGEVRDALRALPTVASGVPPERGASSVEIKTSTRGVDVTVKAYAGSDIGPVGTAAIDEYFRILEEVQERANARSGQ